MANARVTDNLGLTLPGDDTTNTPWGASIHLLTQAIESIDAGFPDHPIAIERRKLGLVPAIDSGIANAYVISISPAPDMKTGAKLFFKPRLANTGPATLAVNGGPPLAILSDGVALTGGEISAGQNLRVIYDGQVFQLGIALPVAAEPNKVQEGPPAGIQPPKIREVAAPPAPVREQEVYSREHGVKKSHK